MILRTLAWKDGRELGVALAALLLLALPLMWAVESDMASKHILPGVTIAAGLMIGVYLLAAEAEDGTLALLDWLMPRRDLIWRTKCVLGVAAVVGLAAILGAAALVRGGRSPDLWAQVTGAMTAGVLALAWGMCCGGIQRSVLRAATCAVVAYVVTWLLLALFAYTFAIEQRGLVDALVAVVLLGLGERAFSHSAPRRTSPEAGSPRSRGVIVWLWWRQARWACLIPAATFVVGLLVPVSWFLCLWFPATTLLGWVCGLGVLGPEQGQARSAWGQQGWPIRRLWLMKALGWSGVAVLTISAIFLGNAMGRWAGSIKLDPWPSFTYIRSFESVAYLVVALGSGLLWSFAVTSLAVLLCERWLTTLTLSLGGSVLLAAAWLPSQLVGGLSPGLVLVGPGLLLLATVWLLPRWAAMGVDWPLRLRGLGALAVVTALTAAVFAWRAWEIPEVDLPPVAQEGPLTDQQKRARAEFEALLDSLVPTAEVDAHATKWSKLNAPFNVTASAEGVLQLDPEYQALLKEVFPEARLNQVENVLSRMAPVPWRPYASQVMPWNRHVAWHRLLLGLQLSAVAARKEGDCERAWRCIRAMLNLGRGVQADAHVFPRMWLRLASLAEQQAAIAMDLCLAATPMPLPVLRQALADFKRHEAELPDVFAAAARRVDYLTHPRTQDHFWALQLGAGSAHHDNGWQSALKVADESLAAALLAAPWEAERRRRRQRVLCAGWLAYIRTFDPGAGVQRRTTAGAGRDDRFFAFADTTPTSTGHAVPLARLQAWSREAPSLFGYLDDVALHHRLLLAQARCRQAQLAVLVFQMVHGRQPKSLDELVPDWLPSVPTDPLGSGPLQYQVLNDQVDIRVHNFVIPAKAMVWSVGKDSVNNQGLLDEAFYYVAGPVFPIPAWGLTSPK